MRFPDEVGEAVADLSPPISVILDGTPLDNLCDERDSMCIVDDLLMSYLG